MTLSVTMRKAESGTLVPVRVTPRSSRTEVDGVHDGEIRVRLKAPPVDGAANKALCAFLAKSLRVPKGAIEIISGERGRSKTVLVRGLEPSQVLSSLFPAEAG